MSTHLPSMRGRIIHQTGEIFVEASIIDLLANEGEDDPIGVVREVVQETINGKFRYAQVAPHGTIRNATYWGLYGNFTPDEFAKLLDMDADYQILGLLPGVLRLRPLDRDHGGYTGILYVWQEDGTIKSLMKY